MRRTNTSALFTGLLLIGIGTLFLLDRFGFADFGHLIRTWWPMMIVFVGAAQIVEGKKMWWGLWMIAVGAWLQLIRLHLFGFNFRNAWPLLLIVIGAGIALRAFFDVMPEEHREP